MRAKIRFIALSMGCLMLLADGISLTGSSAATKELQSRIRFIHPLRVTKNKDIVFGKIISGDSDGTVRVTPSHRRFVTGGVRARKGFRPARFKIRGEPNSTYSIQVSDQSVSNNRGAGILNVTDFEVFSKTVRSITTVGRFNHRGKDTLRIGGTLLVPAGSPKGRYRGRLVINLNY